MSVIKSPPSEADEPIPEEDYFAKKMRMFETHVLNCLSDTHIPMTVALAIRVGLREIYSDDAFHPEQVVNECNEWFTNAYKIQHTLMMNFKQKMQSLKDDICNLPKRDIDWISILELSWLIATMLMETPFAKISTLMHFVEETRERLEYFY